MAIEEGRNILSYITNTDRFLCNTFNNNNNNNNNNETKDSKNIQENFEALAYAMKLWNLTWLMTFIVENHKRTLTDLTYFWCHQMQWNRTWLITITNPDVLFVLYWSWIKHLFCIGEESKPDITKPGDAMLHESKRFYTRSNFNDFFWDDIK